MTPTAIAAARLADALALLDEAESRCRLDPAIREHLTEAHRLTAGLDRYLEQNCGAESPALRALAEQTRLTDWTGRRSAPHSAPLEQEMLSGHVEGRLLQMLARATRAHRVLEIGMFTGYSALALAESLPADGRVVACEIDPDAAQLARRCFAASPAGDRIEVRLGPALESMAALAEAHEQFDLVFIDADKAGYLHYLRAVVRDLLAPGGLVCVDNTLLQGQPWSVEGATGNGAAIAAFNRAVAEDPLLDQVLVPVRDGLTLIRRRAD